MIAERSSVRRRFMAAVKLATLARGGSQLQQHSEEIPMRTLMQLLQGKGGEIHSIAPDARVYDALKLMAEKDVGALVVLEAGRLAGIISERDYARKVILQGKSSHDVPVRDIMTGKVVTVQLTQT